MLDTKTHAKQLNSYLYISFTSWHSQAMFTAWVKSEIQRHARNNSQYTTFLTRITAFYKHLRNRGYPPKWLSFFNHIQYHKIRESAFINGPVRVQKLTLAPPLHIATYYNVRVPSHLWKLILEPTDWLRRPLVDIPPQFKTTLLCFKREHNLSEYLTSATFPPNLANELGWV
jgi:heme-degrading monooxygenase HmoA